MTKSKSKNKVKIPDKGGRPSRFSQSLAEKILALARDGKTEVQIAAAVGISPTTLTNWKGKHPSFLAALKKAKDVADDLVEASLFQRAVGYSHPAIKFFWNPKGGEDGKGAVISQPYVERHPPDTTAAIFWLKNRRPDLWRDTHKHEHMGENGGPIRSHEVTTIEIKKAAVEALADAGVVPLEEY